MKILVTAAATLLLCGSALAQTADPAASGAAAGATPANSAIVVLPAAPAGGSPAYFLADDLDDEDVYGANEEDIGEIEDFVFAADGTIAAVVVEVGGFLGVGEKDVPVDWNAIEVVVQGDDLRVMAPTLTREALEAAEGIDLDTMMLGDD